MLKLIENVYLNELYVHQEQHELTNIRKRYLESLLSLQETLWTFSYSKYAFHAFAKRQIVEKITNNQPVDHENNERFLIHLLSAKNFELIDVGCLIDSKQLQDLVKFLTRLRTEPQLLTSNDQEINLDLLDIVFRNLFGSMIFVDDMVLVHNLLNEKISSSVLESYEKLIENTIFNQFYSLYQISLPSSKVFLRLTLNELLSELSADTVTFSSENSDEFSNYLTKFTQSFTKYLSYLPKPLLNLLKSISNTIANVSKIRMFIDLIYIELLVPAIIFPECYGICEMIVNPETRKNQIEIAKGLLNSYRFFESHNESLPSQVDHNVISSLFDTFSNFLEDPHESLFFEDNEHELQSPKYLMFRVDEINWLLEFFQNRTDFKYLKNVPKTITLEKRSSITVSEPLTLKEPVLLIPLSNDIDTMFSEEKYFKFLDKNTTLESLPKDGDDKVDDLSAACVNVVNSPDSSITTISDESSDSISDTLSAHLSNMSVRLSPMLCLPEEQQNDDLSRKCTEQDIDDKFCKFDIEKLPAMGNSMYSENWSTEVGFSKGDESQELLSNTLDTISLQGASTADECDNSVVEMSATLMTADDVTFSPSGKVKGTTSLIKSLQSNVQNGGKRILNEIATTSKQAISKMSSIDSLSNTFSHQDTNLSCDPVQVEARRLQRSLSTPVPEEPNKSPKKSFFGKFKIGFNKNRKNQKSNQLEYSTSFADKCVVLDDILNKYRRKPNAEIIDSSPTLSIDNSRSTCDLEFDIDDEMLLDANNFENSFAFRNLIKKFEIVLKQGLLYDQILKSGPKSMDLDITNIANLLEMQLTIANSSENWSTSTKLAELIRCLQLFDQNEGVKHVVVSRLFSKLSNNDQKRVLYLDYLVTVKRQKLDLLKNFNRIKKEIAVQNDQINRHFIGSRVVKFLQITCKETFGKFVEDFHSPSLAVIDEKVTCLEMFLKEMRSKLADDQSVQKFCDLDDIEIAQQIVENIVFNTIYESAMFPTKDVDVVKDRLFHDHISKLSKIITPHHKYLMINKAYLYECPWTEAQIIIGRINCYKPPQDKLNCVFRCTTTIMNLLSMATLKNTVSLTADDFIPVLVYVIIMANPPSILSTVQYVTNFISNNAGGEQMYWWTQFCSAVEFIKTMDYN